MCNLNLRMHLASFHVHMKMLLQILTKIQITVSKVVDHYPFF
jgi:hypothetical protein